MLKIAIFGGTFNPVHWGHLLIAETALDQFSLHKVIWVPTYHPPHKPSKLTAFEHRLEMVRLAIAEHTSFLISDVEAQHSGTSYAIATLQSLQILYPNTNWYWIIGLDAFQTLSKWYESQQLIDNCTWLVAPRAPQDAEQEIQDEAFNLSSQVHLTPHLANKEIRYHFLEMPKLGVSSSLVRHYCQVNRSIRYLVPESVRAYITLHKLYSNSR